MGSNHEKKMEVKNLETHSLELVLVTNSEENKLGVVSKIRVTIMIRCENSFFSEQIQFCTVYNAIF